MSTSVILSGNVVMKYVSKQQQFFFIRSANTVMSQFKLAPHSVKYKLHKSFCSSLYGFFTLLWDISAR